MSPSSVAQNLASVEEQIASAARSAGRPRSSITLIAVSKTHPASAIREAYDAGVRHFGENRVQEWEGKRSELLSLPGAVWHLIGHLQSNKAARAARIFNSIDSLDDFALAEKLRRSLTEGEAGERPKQLRALIEVRVADEETKSGVALADLPVFAEKISALQEIDLAGLMCIPPFLEDAEKVRPYFSKLRTVRDELAKRLACPLPVLSMGMSHDFAVAIAEGATEVRIGTAIFGIREKPETKP
ncbi:MAG TPA: YggS family pyridoxal phosphate-dependent enzyme [Candidatus Dormibacteraeota bacterium]|nr:YggS family pyridoxal phosphate-dependent enzyme [Candidatus Dormibacteraeota bacterium]